MAFDAGLVAWVEEAMAPIGALTMRKMMGGAMLYLDGTPFGIVAEDGMWLKADRESDADWDAVGAERFSMTDRNGRVMTMNYRRAPDACLDDGDQLRRWGALAVAAGLRAK